MNVYRNRELLIKLLIVYKENVLVTLRQKGNAAVTFADQWTGSVSSLGR